jgi:putative SOS response-associated peptidase YedK
MCGRYGLYDISENTILKENLGYDFNPNFNAAPTQSMPVLIEQNGNQRVDIMAWGISRKLGPDIEKNIFNTRSDKAFGRFWNKTVLSNRCLVPANGFFEWRRSGGEKIPFWIHEKNSALIYFAGIYSEDIEGNLHYSIMTTTPNQEMAELHDRMPVILDGDKQELWLMEDKNDAEFLDELLRPLPDNSLDMFEVRKEVNVVRNNNNQLILPLNSA